MRDKLDPTYNYAVQAIKQAILNSQLRATRHVNEEQLALYFGIGKYISDNTRKNKWGTNEIENISKQLSIELPGLKGFSGTNLKLMRLFYESWNSLFNSSAMAGEIAEKTSATADEMDENQNLVFLSDSLMMKNRPCADVEMSWSDFFALGFSLHTEILSKTETLEERAFYIHQAVL